MTAAAAIAGRIRTQVDIAKLIAPEAPINEITKGRLLRPFRL